RAAVQRWTRGVFEPVGRALGWAVRPGETDDQRQLRTLVMALLGRSESAWALGEAERITTRYLADTHAVDPGVASIAVRLASRHAPAERADALVAAMRRTTDPAERGTFEVGLTTFLEPAPLRHALDVLLTDAVGVSEVGWMLSYVV